MAMDKKYPTQENSHFLLCDDIRMEMGNKPSIMGWYSNNDILFSPQTEKMVTPFAVAFIAYDGEGEFEVKFEIENPDGEVKIKQELGKSVKKPETAMLMVNKFNALDFSKEGTYKIRIMLDSEEYEQDLKVIKLK